MEVPLLITDFMRRAVGAYPDKTAVIDGPTRSVLAALVYNLGDLRAYAIFADGWNDVPSNSAPA